MSTCKKLNVTCLLGYKLKQTQHALRLHMDEALKALDLTTPQYSVLAQLELRPGISNAALARSAFITAQTMHGIISNLEKRKLVVRNSDPEHGRILRTELTNQGAALVNRAHSVIQKAESAITSAMDKESIARLEKLLLQIFNNLNSTRIITNLKRSGKQ